MAVLVGNPNYTPPINVLRMQKELALLPLWYAAPDDYVWVEELPDLSAFQFPGGEARCITRQAWMTGTGIPSELIAQPWGLSPQSIQFFNELQKEPWTGKLQIPEWKNDYKRLTSRQTAADCLEKIREHLPNILLPDTPLFLSSMNELEEYISQNSPPYVIKSPFSSSGRGVMWINNTVLAEKEKEWLTGAMRKQQQLSIERGLEKVQDFAMEFYLDETGKATYKGLSVFSANNGVYGGNILESQSRLEQRFINYKLSVLNYKSIVARMLEEVYGGYYSGYLGVDMMVYRTADGDMGIHPCVEINMRYTMGMVAIRLFEQYIHPEASGHFFVTYEKDAYRQHQEMIKSYPAVYENGRLRKGYLPLCPVIPETRYRAFILLTSS